MDWRSIEKDPPTPGTGIRATDGKSVFVGHIMQNVPWFTGVSMDDGSEITISTDHLTEWMPMTAPEREKTADGMLLKCGYERVEPETSCVVREYAKQVNGREWRIVATRDGLIEVGTITDMTGLEFKTILACARLIEELEANDVQ